MLTSMVCKHEDFFTPWYRHWAEKLSQEPVGYDPNRPDRVLHRKLWEFNVIAQALSERGMLAPGKKGLGCAVGLEPLPSLFASMGAEILATDLPVEVTTPDTMDAATWAQTGQHATSLDALLVSSLIDADTFRSRVKFMPVDMRELRPLWGQTFDFIWSSCSIEHLGTLEAGMEFVRQATMLLNPGGVAVHTTEFNVSSNDDTLAEGPFVIYRRCDIEKLEYDMRKLRCALVRPDYFAGDHRLDIEFDRVPYKQTPHIKLAFGGHVATSMALIIQKGTPG